MHVLCHAGLPPPYIWPIAWWPQVSSYPRHVYGPNSSSLALDALGLGTQVALFVQPEDEEDAS